MDTDSALLTGNAASASPNDAAASLRALAEHVPGALFQYVQRPDGSNAVVFMSRRCIDLWEVTPEQIQADASILWRMVHPDDLPAMQASVMRSASALEPWQHKWRITTPSGVHKWLWGMGNPFQLPGGEVIWHSFIVDETVTHRAFEALQASQSKLAGVLRVTGDGIWEYQRSARSLVISERFREIFGWPAGLDVVAIGDYLRAIHPDDAPELLPTLSRILDSGESFELEYRIVCPDSAVRWVAMSGGAFESDTGPAQRRFIGRISDITARRHAQEETLRYAHYDPMTGLPNRRLLDDRLSQALVASARSGLHGAVLLIDLDHFKRINDSAGHEVGDEVLKEVARRLSCMVRDPDTVARMGGDEFVVIVSGLERSASRAALAAVCVAERLSAAILPPFRVGEGEYEIGLSVGIVPFHGEDIKPGVLLRNADTAMYRAKASGRGCHAVFEASMQAEIDAFVATERDLRAGIRRGELTAHVQDQFDVEGRRQGVELLVRWLHPTRGLVRPDDFIPVAETGGLIDELGEQVLRMATDLLNRTRMAQPFTVSVNVSARQIQRAHFAERVMRIVGSAGIDLKRLRLEITESALLSDARTAVDAMRALGSHGITFSLDDFGTGFSNFAYLTTLPVTEVKIDRSFVSRVETDARIRSVVAAMIAMAGQLGLHTVAEGVETDAQRQVLHELGCTTFQGYLLSRPKPIEDWIAML